MYSFDSSTYNASLYCTGLYICKFFYFVHFLFIKFYVTIPMDHQLKNVYFWIYSKISVTGISVEFAHKFQQDLWINKTVHLWK